VRLSGGPRAGWRRLDRRERRPLDDEAHGVAASVDEARKVEQQAYARSRPELDGERIIAWGSSFGGGHSILTA
jgi:hypothetical protein